MNKQRTYCILLCFCLSFLCGCLTQETEIQVTVPDLLEPVGSQESMEMVKERELYHLNYSEGEVIPELVPVYIEEKAILTSLRIAVGDTVKKGDDIGRVSLSTLGSKEEIEQQAIEFEQQIKSRNDKITEIKGLLSQPELTTYDKKFQQLLLTQEEEKLETLLNRQEEFLKKLKDDQTEEMQITAPVDGEVVSVVEFDAGTEVDANICLAVIADTTKKIIVCNNASLHTTGIYEDYMMIQGEKVSLMPYPSQSADFLAYTIEDDRKINIGENAIVFRRSEYRNSAVSVSNEAIYADDQGKYVILVENGTHMRRDIKIGNVYTMYTEVLEGLEEGDEVYVQK